MGDGTTPAPATNRTRHFRPLQWIARRSVEAAIREQGLHARVDELRDAVPDISDQYTATFDDKEFLNYWEIKLRGVHAFQIELLLEALSIARAKHPAAAVVLDIGDASGTHPAYLRRFAGQTIEVVSVNLDPVAIAKIRAKGGTAIHSRAEDVDLGDKQIGLCYALETLEHLTDPLRFLHKLGESGKIDHFAFTVPYRRVSRFGGRELRASEATIPHRLSAEDVHVLELSPADWTLLARFAGWRVVHQRIYRQYPTHSLWRLTQPYWRRLDFEGFFGAVCVRDDTLSSRYVNW